MSDSKNSKTDSKNNDNTVNDTVNETVKDESHLTDLYVYRVLNSFKEAGTVDGKQLTKEHGGSPQFWGGGKK
jgi:Fe2+ or Zn2+ uptake regulation protein